MGSFQSAVRTLGAYVETLSKECANQSGTLHPAFCHEFDGEVCGPNRMMLVLLDAILMMEDSIVAREQAAVWAKAGRAVGVSMESVVRVATDEAMREEWSDA